MIPGKILAKFVFAILLVTVFPSAVCSQTSLQFTETGQWVNGVTESWFFDQSISQNDATIAREKWVAIERDLKAGENNIWAGSYFTGSDTVTVVSLELNKPARAKGLNLFVDGADDHIKVTETKGRFAKGLIVRTVTKRPCVKTADEDCTDPDYPPIKVGWRASSYRFDN